MTDNGTPRDRYLVDPDWHDHEWSDWIAGWAEHRYCRCGNVQSRPLPSSAPIIGQPCSNPRCTLTHAHAGPCLTVSE